MAISLRKTWIILLVFVSINCQSQQDYDVFWVQFKDKKNSPFSVFKAQEFLSPRALERRQRYGLMIDETDLPVNPLYINTILKQGFELHSQSKWLNGIAIKRPKAIEPLSSLLALEFVQAVEAIGYSRNVQTATDSMGPRDYRKSYKQKKSFYGNGKNQIQMLNGHYIHQMGYTGKGMHIAILDGGFSDMRRCPVFDSLWANEQILGTHDFVEGDDFVFESSSHGRNVASCMASKLPGVLVGTAPDASYYLFKTEDVKGELRIEEYNWVAAIEEADRLGVDLVNSSLGYYDFDDDQMDYSYQDLDGQTSAISLAAKMAANKGMLLVSSAGNEGSGTWKKITVPADVDNIMTVGAVSRDGYHARFSSYGIGDKSYIKPNLMARGVLAVVGAVKSYESSYSNGTSFSAPILAGMTASFWQAFPDLSNAEIIQTLENYADNYNRPDTAYGYGIPDFYASSKALNTAIIEINNSIHFYRVPVAAGQAPFFVFKNKVEKPLKLNLETAQGTQLWTNTAATANEAYQKLHIVQIPIWNDLSAGVYFLNIRMDGRDKKICLLK